MRVEAWAPSRERCIAEAAVGTVETFLDISTAHATGETQVRVSGGSDEDLLAAVVGEVIYLLDTTGEVPVDVEIGPVDGDLEVRFATVDAATLPQVGAVPKAITLHELSLETGPQGWTCSVILDV